MSLAMLFRLLFFPLFAAILGYRLYNMDAYERTANLPPNRTRYQTFYIGTLLAVYTALLVVYLLFDPSRNTLRFLMGYFLLTFCYITVYYSVLLALLPILRKRISARACGFLWFLPNCLYLVLYGCYDLEAPLVVLRPPTAVLGPLCATWATGAAAILIRSIWQHLRFRRKLLRDASPVTDSAVLQVWHEEQAWAGYPKFPYRLLYAPAARTPLSIGLWAKTIRVVLPPRDYSPQDLKLIFRHELIHIGRGDASNKLFLTLTTALFWFNPLMWAARRRSADDLELSCDETVLLDQDGETRRRYAELLLTTAGEQRGFTTCLSGSAQALRYRLKCVVAPAKRSAGAAVLAAAFLALALPFGLVTFAREQTTVGEKFFPQGTEACRITSCSYFDVENSYTTYQEPDQEALLALLSALPIEQLAGRYDHTSAGKPTLYLHGSNGQDGLWVELSDDALLLHLPDGGHSRGHAWHLSQPPDWDALLAVLGPEKE